MPHECDVCGREFSRKANLARHRDTIHGDVAEISSGEESMDTEPGSYRSADIFDDIDDLSEEATTDHDTESLESYEECEVPEEDESVVDSQEVDEEYGYDSGDEKEWTLYRDWTIPLTHDPGDVPQLVIKETKRDGKNGCSGSGKSYFVQKLTSGAEWLDPGQFEHVSPRDQSMVTTLAKQMFPGHSKFLQECYEDAVNKKTHGHLFLDLHPESPNELRSDHFGHHVSVWWEEITDNCVMEYGRKMALVPQELLSTIQAKQQEEMTPLVKSALSMDDQMRDVMSRQDLADDEKATLYQQLLQRYLTYRDKRRAEPVSVRLVTSNSTPDATVTATNNVAKDEGSTTSASTASATGKEDEAILAAFPKNMKARAQQLLNVIKHKGGDILDYNQHGELLYDKQVVPGSQISDLLRDVIQRRQNFNPIGWRAFSRGMARLNTPEAAIRHPTQRIRPAWSRRSRGPASAALG
ncbi:hypothetical protein Bbelb_254350 [Branchiostoma belcheri]|nr:hypothetical protein Bbelb_254350 [Branchiostoma belcheri]